MKLSGRFRPGGREVKKHCVLQCFSTFRDGFAAQYKVKRGSKVFAKQNSRHVSSETGLEAYYFEVSFARLQRNGVPRSLDATRTVHACNETGFDAYHVLINVGTCEAKRGSKHFDCHNNV